MVSASSRLPAALILAKHWQDGPVKTRLAADVGEAKAREIYRDMVEKLWSALAHPQLQRHLWVAPADALESCKAWLPGATTTQAQPEGNLTPRLQAAFHHAFAADPELPWAAVLGTDCPALDAAFVLFAGRALGQADMVISPTHDGGYALLGLREPQPHLFEDIPWSTPEVLTATLARAAELGLEVVQTATLRDLDDFEDLQQLQAEGLI